MSEICKTCHMPVSTHLFQQRECPLLWPTNTGSMVENLRKARQAVAPENQCLPKKSELKGMTQRITLVRIGRRGDLIHYTFRAEVPSPVGSVLVAVGSFTVRVDENQPQFLETRIDGVTAKSIFAVMAVQLNLSLAYFAMRRAGMSLSTGIEFVYDCEHPPMEALECLTTQTEQAPDIQESN